MTDAERMVLLDKVFKTEERNVALEKEVQLLRKAIDAVLKAYDQHHTEVGYQILKFARDGVDITEKVDWGRVDEIKSVQMQQQPFRTAKDALTYWMAQYQLAYGTEYKPSNWGRETYQLKILLERHGAVLLKHIIDVVMRMYPTRWTSQRFPRPTIGALVSWLAAQAEPFARANMDAPATEATVTDDTDVVAEYESKGWL